MQNVYTRLNAKFHSFIKEPLDLEERNKLEDMLIDSYVEEVTRVDDEELLKMADDRGLFL